MCKSASVPHAFLTSTFLLVSNVLMAAHCTLLVLHIRLQDKAHLEIWLTKNYQSRQRQRL